MGWQDPLPDWVKRSRKELQQAYKSMAPIISERCRKIAQTGSKNREGKLADDLGTLSDYRADATYCLGVAERLSVEEAEAAAAAKERKGWTKEQPWAPQAIQEALAAKKQAEPPPAPMPEPDDAFRQFRLEEFMHRFTQREAEALILTVGLMMPDKDAAWVMGCSVSRVQALLLSARRKFNGAKGSEAG